MQFTDFPKFAFVCDENEYNIWKDAALCSSVELFRKIPDKWHVRPCYRYSASLYAGLTFAFP